jgi:hypothetical protein
VKRPGSKQSARREIFVLTPEEKKTISFVLIMFVLGLATAKYRAAHAIPPSRIAVKDTATTTSRPAQKRSEAKHSKPPN